MKTTRRDFVSTALLGSLACTTSSWARSSKIKLKKAVKFEMIDGNTILERFELAKKCGFLGVEADSPSKLDRDEMVRARDKTGILIHGVIDSIHWNKRLSDPNPEVRAQGLEALKNALRDAKYFGADTCLLVPGAVRNKETENFDQCWERSTIEVKKTLPLAEKLGVKIAIEVVWNDFLTTPELLIKYVDQFNSPWVGAYFDCSNMIKYGVPPAEWIRRLGKRMLKFDFKGYHLEKKKWVGIGEGTENWPEILKACEEVGYHTWATAELGRCKEPELMEISRKMDKILELN
ncbi:MAG TPA: sugar phosphate isomerase/epimerase family protein [Gemmatales bacterium]|nr:sugar phosphate isomerase/epimerase family protein [Gemmatales bacterium]